jgi:negative regulator of flagellin synthesis FlgM
MIISGKNIQQIAKIYGDQVKPAKMNKSESTGKLAPDEVVLSTEAKEFSQMLQKLKAMPEVRQDKVQAIEGQLASGTYQVDSKAVAQKILQSLQADRPR